MGWLYAFCVVHPGQTGSSGKRMSVIRGCLSAWTVASSSGAAESSDSVGFSGVSAEHRRFCCRKDGHGALRGLLS